MNDTANTTLADFLRHVTEGHEHVLEIVRQATGQGDADTPPETTTVALQRRTLQPEPPQAPEKAESPRRAHVFHDAAGFTAYLEKYKTANTVVLADVHAQTIFATIDETAADGFETIVLCPTIHPLFAPWKDLLECLPKTVAEFAEFILANRRAVIAPEVRDLIQTLGQVRASKNVTLERGNGTHSINGLMVETTIQGKSKADYIDLPEAITIHVPLFIGTAPRQIDIDLLAAADESQIFMRCVSADVATATVEAFEEMLTECRALDGVVVAMGRAATTPWAYLR